MNQIYLFLTKLENDPATTVRGSWSIEVGKYYVYKVNRTSWYFSNLYSIACRLFFMQSLNTFKDHLRRRKRLVITPLDTIKKLVKIHQYRYETRCLRARRAFWHRPPLSKIIRKWQEDNVRYPDGDDSNTPDGDLTTWPKKTKRGKKARS